MNQINMMNDFSGMNKIPQGNTSGGKRQSNNNVKNDMRKERIMFASPSFNYILLNIIELSSDHSGSRLVQKKYEDSSDEEKQQMFEKIYPEIYNLTKDVFGNYVIQKILEFSNGDIKKIIAKQLEARIYELTSSK